MSIQIPTTEFTHDGKIFLLVVAIGTYEDILLPVDFENNKKYLMLTNENIESVLFENALNLLYMTGSLVYSDVEGYITDFLNRTNVEVIIDLRRILTTSDGDVSIKNTDTSNTFYHEFLVDNIQILDRDGGTLKYKLFLVSKHYTAMIKTLHYSNYNKKPEKLTDILKILLKQAASGFSDEPLFKLSKQFEADECASDVKINYATNGNDNMLTISKFLLSRMFYYLSKSAQGKDESMKFLFYDLFNNCYNMFDLGKVDATNSYNDKLILSMFKTPEERLAYADENLLATVVSFPLSKYKKLVFGTHTYDYDLLHNTILHEYVSLKTFTKYHDKTDSANVTEVEQLTEPVEDPNNPDYANLYAYWTNRYAVYLTMVDSLMGSNALIVNTGPTVRRMPSDTIFIAIPPDKSGIMSDSKKEYESVAGRYGQLQGMWIIGKVRNIIFPSRSIYKQNLVLFKNFLTKKEVAN